MTHAVLTAIGSDRPGIVDEVSRYIFDRGGNIEDSRMVNLRGQFAMMVLVGGAEDVLERLGRELADFGGRSGLRVELQPAGPGGPARAVDALPYRLVGTGIDQPGLVHRLAHLLRDLGVNIESLETRLTPAPYTGAPMFELEAVLAVPRATPPGGLRQKVATLCDELNVDWDLRAG